MLRLFAFIAFAALPLVAQAHEGHQAPAEAESGRPRAAAPSHCPGGGNELCCCHDASGSTPFQPVAVADAARARLALPCATACVARPRDAGPRRAVLANLRPRGPPLLR